MVEVRKWLLMSKCYDFEIVNFFFSSFLGIRLVLILYAWFTPCGRKGYFFSFRLFNDSLPSESGRIDCNETSDKLLSIYIYNPSWAGRINAWKNIARKTPDCMRYETLTNVQTEDTNVLLVMAVMMKKYKGSTGKSFVIGRLVRRTSLIYLFQVKFEQRLRGFMICSSYE